mgnify:CR=1 FL=1
MKTPNPTPTLRSIGLPLVLAAAVAVAIGWHWLARVDGVLYDHALRHGWREGPRDIVIIAIDDESLQAIGPWPWRRAIHAEAIKQAHAAGARSVLLNLLLTEPDPTQDAALATALPGAHVVLPVAPPAPGSGGEGALLPVAPLRGSVQLGHADAAADPDGVVRRADEERVTIRRRLRGLRCAHGAARACAVFNQHTGSELIVELCGKRTGEGVGAAAGCERHDEGDRLGRIGGLRQRAVDIPLLVRHFEEKLRRPGQAPLPDNVIDDFCARSWPGASWCSASIASTTPRAWRSG